MEEDNPNNEKVDSQKSRKRVYRKWYLDHHCRSRYDTPYRSFAKCFNSCIWPDHLKPQRHSIKGSAFLEILLVLPLFLILALGLFSVVGIISERYALGSAAQAAVSVMVNGGSQSQAQQTLLTILTKDGYTTQGLTLSLQSWGTLVTVNASLPITVGILNTQSTVHVTRTGETLNGSKNYTRPMW